jgi:hypothetical protein
MSGSLKPSGIYKSRCVCCGHPVSGRTAAAVTAAKADHERGSLKPIGIYKDHCACCGHPFGV